MTVGELLIELTRIDPEVLVVLQKDAEGNGYSPLSGIDVAHYEAECSWSGEVTDEPTDTSVGCVVFWPVN